VSSRGGTSRVFVLYRDSALRREALESPPGSPARYSLYGLDELAASGVGVQHNLEPAFKAGAATRVAGSSLDRAVRVLGGYSGDFESVLACRAALKASDVVFSTVDTVGIPLVLLSRARLVRTPIVYAAIGLPERIEQLVPRIQQRYAAAYRRLHALVAYGWSEVEALRAWLGEGTPHIEFVPFGVDPDVFSPAPEATLETDVVSIGADPRRDYALLLALAERRPEWSFWVVASREQLTGLVSAPPNVTVELDVPFDVAQKRLISGRVVVLPVRDNSYSGATTTLLQAMARAKPVVVSRTAAIARGYHLEDGLNCRLVSPGDLAALEHAVSDLLGDRERASVVGLHARQTVERHLSWRRYVQSIRDLLLSASGRTTFSA
jgi:glycosyltransferase involved in cell wall biosynthesis